MRVLTFCLAVAAVSAGATRARVKSPRLVRCMILVCLFVGVVVSASIG